jgi:TonB family protein
LTAWTLGLALAASPAAAPAQTIASPPPTIVKIKCKVTDDGHLRDCVVLSVDPPGKTYADQALRLSQQLKMTAPGPADPKAPPREVTIPISFANKAPDAPVPSAAPPKP